MNSFLDRVLHRARGEVAPSVHPRRRSAFEPAPGEGSGIEGWRLQSPPGQGLPGDSANGDPPGVSPGDSGPAPSEAPDGREGGPGRPGPRGGSLRRPGFPGSPEAVSSSPSIQLPGPLEGSFRSPLRSPPTPTLGPPPGANDAPVADGRDGEGASTPVPGRKVSLRPSRSWDRGGAPSPADSPSPSETPSWEEDAPERLGPAGRKQPVDGSGSLVPRSDGASGSLLSLRTRPSPAAGNPGLQGAGTAPPGPQGQGDHATDSRDSPGRKGDTRREPSAGAGGHEPPAPVVQVTIGRIEIRAPARPSPPAHPPRPAPAPVPESAAGPRLGLEDYLQQRVRGER